MSASQVNSLVSNSTTREKGTERTYVGKNKRIFELLFKTCPLDDTYMICKICPEESLKKRKKKGAGYQNALNHLKLHPNFEQLVNEAEKSHDNSIQPQIVTEQAIQLFSWMDWIIIENLPFAFLTKSSTKKYSKIKPISIPTFLKYMNRLTKIVEAKIAKKLGSKFGLIIDGWDAKAFSVTGIYANLYSNSDPNEWYDKIYVVLFC